MPEARRAKIVCTLGPASETPESIAGLIEAGMDVARLNFSHGSHEEHAQRVERIRGASAAVGRTVGILQDLRGPKIRTGSSGPASLETGDTLRIEPGQRGDEKTLCVDHPSLVADVSAGECILLADGAIELRVEQLLSDAILCRVEHGGALRTRMGVNLPSARLQVDAISDKDRADLALGLASDVDFVALSFVRSAQDISELRQLVSQVEHPPLLVSKIETPSAVENLEAIVRASDAVMVARGDLGVELAPEVVPSIQKDIIGACRRFRRPVIVATEMLQSMVSGSRPTRAEASDVANAIFDGADAVMLSAETAVGDDPARACATMARIASEAAMSRYAESHPSPPSGAPADSVARAACAIADEIGATCIATLTRSGHTASFVSFAQPRVPVVAFSPDERARRRLTLFRGVDPRPQTVEHDLEALVRSIREALREGGFAREGECFVLVFGTPGAPAGTTDAIRVVTT